MMQNVETEESTRHKQVKSESFFFFFFFFLLLLLFWPFRINLIWFSVYMRIMLDNQTKYILNLYKIG